ncbi:MarR family winged helix-turn-helix transcriptional regulator [Sphingomonas immobilis]|jgi:DNA-binding MarR family transcriptional regulator|uniref:MarR family transcriptional regulator n=1 Tax=Sphingomonas immobilis TaxID=3063997 RepID=A0ABT8ZYC5_9SPHN|nr:MarR family transcriptional regulator [Sphingomonas sp. CA1-15]MDO7842283.1 MarR family transcriptional regulator [Sphingomonas sp. CA1-15]
MRANALISYRISLIGRLQRTRFDARARSLGITRAQWRAIYAISCYEGASQRRIAELIEVSDVTAGRLIDRLVDSGWVERRADAADRRTHRLYLTSLALPLLDRLAQLGANEETIALAGVDPAALEIALGVLDRVIANIESAPRLVEVDPIACEA